MQLAPKLTKNEKKFARILDSIGYKTICCFHNLHLAFYTRKYTLHLK